MFMPKMEKKMHSQGLTHARDESLVPLEAPAGAAKPDLICFSHLRWDFVFQRPQHILTRFAKERRVFFVEEPVFGDWHQANFLIAARQENVTLLVPRLPFHMQEGEWEQTMRDLMDSALDRWRIKDWVAWYYTPMALSFSAHLKPIMTVFDCMDELSAFSGAPPEMVDMERRMMAKADLVLTGGASLYEAKKSRHHNVHAFPSSIDKAHFLQARFPGKDPQDQASIPRPRVGFHGVVDERMDLGLLSEAASLRPDWQWILVGPVCKIDPDSLPRRANIHYLGKKEYSELPAYLGHWDAAMMPFAHNSATRFISPTKTPEYLAAGLPVISTSIKDVADPYGKEGLVLLADTPLDFVGQCEKAMSMRQDAKWQEKVTRFMADMSWDTTWSGMNGLVERICQSSRGAKGRIHV